MNTYYSYEKSVYLGISILELSTILMYQFWHNYVKPKYCEKEKLLYGYIHCFSVYIKTDDIFKDIAEDVKTSFDTSSYELNKPFKRQFKDELDGKSMTKFVGLRANICGYSVDDGSED